MESTAPPGQIQVSERAYERLQSLYDLEPRGAVELRGRGEMATWLLSSRRPDASATDFPAPKAPVVDLATAGAGRGGWLGARRTGRMA